MKFMKKNRPDVMIIILLILWGIYEIFVVPFEYDILWYLFLLALIWCIFFLGAVKKQVLNI